MTTAKSISLVLPMYNEEYYLRKTIPLAIRTLDSITDDYEIVIVDDASDDGSGQIADEMARQNRRIRVLHHTRNSKLGITLRTGFSAASKGLILYSDLDLPFDLEEIKRSLRIMELTECDIVTAYRHDRTSEGFVRAIYSAVYNMLIRILFGVRVRDINFACKLVKKGVLDSIALESSGSFIDAELIIKAHRRGYRISQFGIDYFARMEGKSRLSGLRDIWQILKEMAHTRCSLWGEGRGCRHPQGTR